ncbi:SOS response-associated peptidase family protein [Undibacterium sp. 5I1]|uniref:SOS response-associated peptidase family protein n=1 Tax=unclassified Undibacterium TaxID=2630295 RepID=UPI002AB42D14|nr:MULTISPECIES: SOS response-associated peptidase family protein [unclassified Undibacterium]MDY7537870.1 SOS response-associated peptidase family protein [Undibacterium sp. 5I1]MEB0232994.1 SOS response-associated peptidase family protein [Undibacterium sp. 10I3]MEB0259770.1 SOS response-associated peptidase family protein [Undibacterium sp. 5I1]
MCVNYVTVSKQTLANEFNTVFDQNVEWNEELYRDYLGPIIIKGTGTVRQGLVANYGMIPKRFMPPGLQLSTMNARSDTVGSLRTYRQYWKTCQFCLVPMKRFFEPNYEAGEHIRWSLGMRDESAFAVAGIYREWEETDGTTAYAFTQLTINADEHSLMKRFHKNGEEKRQLVIIPRSEYDDWLGCTDPEFARTFLQGFDPELMAAAPAPKPKKSVVMKKAAGVDATANPNFDLFA